MTALESQPPVRIVRLTPREREVLDAFMIDGADNATLALRLGIRDGTVKTHIKHLLSAFDVSNRAAMALEVERGHTRIRTYSLRTPAK